MNHLLLHTPLAGFTLVFTCTALTGMWALRRHRIGIRVAVSLIVANVIGTIVGLELLRLVLKGAPLL